MPKEQTTSEVSAHLTWAQMDTNSIRDDLKTLTTAMKKIAVTRELAGSAALLRRQLEGAHRTICELKKSSRLRLSERHSQRDEGRAPLLGSCGKTGVGPQILSMYSLRKDIIVHNCVSRKRLKTLFTQPAREPDRGRFCQTPLDQRPSP